VDSDYRTVPQVNFSAGSCSHRQAAGDPEVTLIGGSLVQRCVATLSVAESRVALDSGLHLGRGFIGMQTDILVFH